MTPNIRNEIRATYHADGCTVGVRMCLEALLDRIEALERLLTAECDCCGSRVTRAEIVDLVPLGSNLPWTRACAKCFTETPR